MAMVGRGGYADLDEADLICDAGHTASGPRLSDALDKLLYEQPLCLDCAQLDDCFGKAHWAHGSADAILTAQASAMRTLYADFNNVDAAGNLPLNCAGSLKSIDSLAEPLRDGEQVTLSDGELRVVAQVFKCADGVWEARSDWSFTISN